MSGIQEKLKMLVVDDEIDNLDLLYRTFRKEFQVFKAESAQEALNILAKEGEMAIIIADQRMPHLKGTDLLSKTLETFPNTIRILLTGYTDVEDLVKAINFGQVFKYITKPWNPYELKEIIQQAAQTYQILRQRTEQITRAWQKEALFNTISTALRESLDYQSILATIVKSIGENFTIGGVILTTVENDFLTDLSFTYSADGVDFFSENFPNLMTNVLQNKTIQISQDKELTEIAIPLIERQEILAILYLYQLKQLDLKFLESISNQCALAVAQAKLYQTVQQQNDKILGELEIAREIQNHLLPSNHFLLDNLKITGNCTPAKQVGGDFFEIYQHTQGDIWLAVGDVSGKGIPAALFMASIISLLRQEISSETIKTPDTVLYNLNQAMLNNLASANSFITMVLIRYSPKNRQLLYANAGHIYPLKWSGNSLYQNPQYLKMRHIPLGILPNWQKKLGKIELAPGDIFLLASDGITEAPLITNNNKLNTSRLEQEGLWQLILQQPLPFSLEKLLLSFRHVTESSQEDDQTILCLEVLS